jgi:2-hydroxymuconate-semialdehyde hydrolase
MADNPEIGLGIETCGYKTNYHDHGSGEAVLLLHGSGAGVSGFVNWRGLMPVLAETFRVVAPDLVGFGFTETPADYQFRFMDGWIEQIIALLDALGIEKTHVVGNSFGGALALWLAWRHPARFDRLVLMGPGGWPAKVGEELAALWGYTPSQDNMRRAMSVMAYNQALITDELVEMRTRATMRPGAQEIFERIFPKPHQRWLDAQVLPISALQEIDNQVLIIHGRDDRVVPTQVSWNLHHHLASSQLHMFGKCGHWTMIEQAARFQSLVSWFLSEGR